MCNRYQFTGVNNIAENSEKSTVTFWPLDAHPPPTASPPARATSPHNLYIFPALLALSAVYRVFNMYNITMYIITVAIYNHNPYSSIYN